MIKDQFLPTSVTSGIFELTDYMRNLTGEDPAKPYYMGYVKDEDFPSMWKFSYWGPDLDTGKITITQVNENRPWGFTVVNRVNYYYGTSLVNDGNGNWVFFGSTYNIVDTQLINKAEMARVTMTQYMTFVFRIVAKSGTYTWNYDKNYTRGLNKTYTDFLAFINGEQTWTISTPIDGTIDINYSDFNESGWAELSTSNNVVYYIWLIEAKFPYGSTNAAGSSDNKVVPFYRTTVGDLGRYAYIAPSGYAGAGAAISSDSVRINGTTWQISGYTTSAYGVPCGLPPAELYIEQIVNVCVPRGGNGLVSGRYFLMWNNTNEYLAYFVPYLFKDIKNWLSNFNKFWTGTVYDFPPTIDSYTTATFVDLYNTDNTPKYNISTLPFSPALDKILQPWQKPAYDISEDEFDVDSDLPGGGGGGGDTPSPEPRDLPHDEGDPAGLQNRSLSAPTGFITQYALTYSEVSTVGLNLWTSWLTNNTDVWKNFFLPYQQDFGTLNISAAMETIISLRAYPFEFPLDVLLPAPNGVRMGTGHTDFLGSSTMAIMTTICKIPLGECEVKPESPYDDFRDMYNASISCFLPYCGSVELNPAEVIGRTLKCYYLVDFQSGGCTAVITMVGDKGEYILASKSGQIGFTLPVTATNAGQLAARTMSDAVQTIGTIGGFFFDVAGSIGRSAESAVKAGAGAESGAVDSESTGMTVTESLGVGKSGFKTGLQLANQVLNRLSRSGVDIPMISGGSGAEAMFFPDTAIVTIRRGKYAKPENYPHSQGHLNGSSNTISYYKGSWGDYSPQTGKGLCKFTGVDTTGLTCHEDERAEILAILESGIYL